MKKKSHKEIFEGIVDSLAENEISEHDSPRDYLESKGIDIDEQLEGGLELVNQWKNSIRLRTRRAQLESLRIRMDDFLSGLTDSNPSLLKEKLLTFLAGDSDELAVAYWHKLEKLTDGDLARMSKEQELLDCFIELFEDLDSENES